MKTKLLKKIRKRFSIVHYPNGYLIQCFNTTIERYKKRGCVCLKVGEASILTVDLEDYFLDLAYEKCTEEILKWCRANYSRKANHVNNRKFKGIKLWHNG